MRQSERDAIEGLRAIQNATGIDFAAVARGVGNEAAAKATEKAMEADLDLEFEVRGDEEIYMPRKEYTDDERRDLMILAATKLEEYVQDSGGCDHSVGICFCQDLILIQSLREAAAR